MAWDHNTDTLYWASCATTPHLFTYYTTMGNLCELNTIDGILLPSMLWAVTSAVPVATAVILPQLSTRTMLGFDVAHVTPRSAFAGSRFATAGSALLQR